MIITCLLYDGMASLDAIGPVTVFGRIPGAEIRYMGLQKGIIHTAKTNLAMVADYELSEITSSDIVIIPGGWAARQLIHHEPLLQWLRNISTHCTYLTSVCTGALLLGAAGLLKGKTATTHWSMLGSLAQWEAIATNERIVDHGHIITSAGVSAGIDMALYLTAKIKGEDIARAIQLKIEYDPKPPFNGGSLSKESDAIIALAKSL